MERLIKIDSIRPKSAVEVKTSKLGIGFEKLDRAVFDPNKAYDKVAQLGVKWIRLQSGWARTEKEKGIYDFAWLDDIVDNLIVRLGIDMYLLLHSDILGESSILRCGMSQTGSGLILRTNTSRMAQNTENLSFGHPRRSNVQTPMQRSLAE